MNIKEHKRKILEIGCIVSGNPNCVAHHCCGGSMLEYGFKRGIGMKNSDWLVIPLSVDFHTGDLGIHRIGVKTWEKQFGTQINHLKTIGNLLGYDVIEIAQRSKNKQLQV